MLRPGTFGLTLLLAMLTALGPLSMDMYLPSLPDISHVLAAPAARTQLTISSYLIGFAVGQVALRSAVGSLWAAAGAARRYHALSDKHARLHRGADRSTSDRRAALTGRRRVGGDRARPRHRARSLFRRAGGARVVADGLDQRVCADRGADDRRRAAVRVRLARQLRLHERWRDRRVLVAVRLLPETLRRRPADRCRCSRWSAATAPLRGTAGF